MNLYDFFEELNLEKHQVTDKLVYQIIQEIPRIDLIKLANKWPSGLSTRHQVPGNAILTMAGICDYYQEHHDMTHKQKIFLVNHLIRYWDQRDLVTRSEMYV
jgi:hypothetical protein